MNWDNVGAFLRVVGSEFQRDGAKKLKERCPNDLSFRFGILNSFSLEDRRERDVVVVVVNWDPDTCSLSGMVWRQCWHQGPGPRV